MRVWLSRRKRSCLEEILTECMHHSHDASDIMSWTARRCTNTSADIRWQEQQTAPSRTSFGRNWWRAQSMLAMVRHCLRTCPWQKSTRLEHEYETRTCQPDAVLLLRIPRVYRHQALGHMCTSYVQWHRTTAPMVSSKQAETRLAA